jgi:O-antigen ligase
MTGTITTGTITTGRITTGMTTPVDASPGSTGPAPPATGRKPTLLQVLVIGGSAIAPLNLLLVRSFTAYDALIALAMVILVAQRRVQMPPRGYVVAAFAFILAALLSAFRATYILEALTQTLQYAFVFFVLMPVVLSVVRSRRAVLVSILMLCVGTLGAVLHSYLTQQTQGAGRVLVFYSDNPNRLGYPTAYLLPMLFVLWLSTRRMRLELRLLATAAGLGGAYLAVWALGASASRSSVVGTLVALVVFVVVRPGMSPARVLARAGGLAAALALFGLLISSTGHLPHTLEDRIERSVSSDAQDQGKLVGDREHLANAGIRAFVDSPFLGTGLDNFRYVTVDYDQDATPQLPHNLWLQLLAQVGVFGALAVASMLLLWLRDVVRAYRQATSSIDRNLLWALTAALSGVLTILMFAPEMLDRHYWLLVSLGLAVVAGVRRHRTEEILS